MGRMDLFWQPALVLVIIVCTLCAVIWANKDACLLACSLSKPLGLYIGCIVILSCL